MSEKIISGTAMCCQRDVKIALNNSISRFCEEGHSKIGELMDILENELSQVPLYEVCAVQSQTTEDSVVTLLDVESSEEKK